MNKLDRTAAHWSSLPPELLESIARKLIVHADYIRFRTVCTTWRASTPEIPTHLPCQLPWLMLSQSLQNSHRRAFLTVANNKLHYLNLPEASHPRRRCGSSYGWLIILEESPSVFLINPLTRARINLPPLTTFPNVVSFDFSNVGHEYILRMPPPKPVPYTCSLQDMRKTFINKIVLSNSPSGGSHFVALAIIHKTGEVAYCKSDQNSWNLIEEARSFSQDFTYLNGLFYGLGRWGDIAVCDVNGDSPVVEIIHNHRPFLIAGDKQYLVNAMGELLLVMRFLRFEVGPQQLLGYKTIDFKVFRFNFNGLVWKGLRSLGDKALFLGENSSLALLASDFPGCKGNRVYFTDDCSLDGFDNLRGHDLGIFNLEDGSVEPLPCYPRLQWPPPIWVTPNPCS